MAGTLVSHARFLEFRNRRQQAAVEPVQRTTPPEAPGADVDSRSAIHSDWELCGTAADVEALRLRVPQPN